MYRREAIGYVLAAILPGWMLGKGKKSKPVAMEVQSGPGRIRPAPSQVATVVKPEGVPAVGSKWPVAVPRQVTYEWRLRSDSPNDYYLIANDIQLGVWCTEQGGYWQSYNPVRERWGKMQKEIPLGDVPELPKRMAIEPVAVPQETHFRVKC